MTRLEHIQEDLAMLKYRITGLKHSPKKVDPIFYDNNSSFLYTGTSTVSPYIGTATISNAINSFGSASTLTSSGSSLSNRAYTASTSYSV